jgi:arsenite methyltransferase
MKESVASSTAIKADYGIDAPAVLRNLFLFGMVCLLLGALLPSTVHVGPVAFKTKPMFFTTGACLIVEGFLYLLYVKHGKYRHRDYVLSLHRWKGNEQVLDVGCGRGLLLAGAAKRVSDGHATGIDIWSTKDLSGNTEDATLANLEIEGVRERCTLVSRSAAEMPFNDASFDVVVSNLCLHNLYDRQVRRAAVQHIARVLRPGGVALLSDYKRTGEYAEELRLAGFTVETRRGNFLATFPPLTVVIARKPL